jgi:DNA repair protein RecO (recombination protein O)
LEQQAMAELPILQPAYLLHARDYRDSSLLIELFTPTQGRIAAVARGVKTARRGGALQRALLQPFQPLWIAVQGRGELKNLRNGESRDLPLALRGRALFSGFYLNELMCRVLQHEDPHPELFVDYEHALQSLTTQAQIDVVLRKFELQLLAALGYGISLEFDAEFGAAIEPNSHYQFDVQRGLLPDFSRSRGSSLQTVFYGQDILDFNAGHYSAEARRALKSLCRLALRPHLGDQPLRSRLLFATDR